MHKSVRLTLASLNQQRLDSSRVILEEVGHVQDLAVDRHPDQVHPPRLSQPIDHYNLI